MARSFMPLTFKNAKLDDLPQIVTTYNATIASRSVTAELKPVSIEDKLSWFNSHHQKRPLWIIEIDKKYAGWLSFKDFNSRQAYSGAAEISIYLENSFQGQGLGKICLQKAVDYAKEIDIHTLVALIFGHNLASLQLFYSMGFKKWGHLPEIADMDGIMRDLLILGRKTSENII